MSGYGLLFLRRKLLVSPDLWSNILCATGIGNQIVTNCVAKLNYVLVRRLNQYEVTMGSAPISFLMKFYVSIFLMLPTCVAMMSTEVCEKLKVQFGLATSLVCLLPSGCIHLEFSGSTHIIELLHPLLHTLAVSMSVACASGVQWFTRECTSLVLASFHFQIMEQLQDHIKGSYMLKKLRPNCDGQLKVRNFSTMVRKIHCRFVPTYKPEISRAVTTSTCHAKNDPETVAINLEVHLYMGQFTATTAAANFSRFVTKARDTIMHILLQDFVTRYWDEYSKDGTFIADLGVVSLTLELFYFTFILEDKDIFKESGMSCTRYQRGVPLSYSSGLLVVVSVIISKCAK